VSRDSVARDLLAVLCKKHGFLVDEAETASDARMLLDALRQRSGPRAERRRGAGPFFACVVDVRPFFSRGPALLQELGATGIENLVLIADEGNGETPAAAEAAGAVAVLARPFEGDAIIRILGGLTAPRGGRPGC
jgi:DNA-binding NtrC family response regulator